MKIESKDNKRLITIESYDTRLWYDLLTAYDNYTDFSFTVVMNSSMKKDEIKDDIFGREFSLNISANPEDGTQPLFYFADETDNDEVKIYDQDYLELDLSNFQTFVESLSDALDWIQEDDGFNAYGDTDIFIIIAKTEGFAV